MEVGPSSCATEPDAPGEDELGARWATVEQARLAVFSWIACYSHRRRGSALPVVGGGGRPVRSTVVLAGRSVGGLQRRLGVLGPGLGRPGASPLGHDHRGPVPLGVLHHLPGHLGQGALRRPARARSRSPAAARSSPSVATSAPLACSTQTRAVNAWVSSATSASRAPSAMLAATS